MCFSPQADVAGGVLICAIGIDAIRHIRQRREFIALAWIPVLLGAHQFIEALVWLWLQGHVPRGVGHVALWAYLLIAFVLGNSQTVRVSFVFFHADISLIWVLLIAAVLGALVDRLVIILRSRGDGAGPGQREAGPVPPVLQHPVVRRLWHRRALRRGRVRAAAGVGLP